MSDQTYAAPPTGAAIPVKAGFWIRFGAAIIDGVLLGVINVALTAAIGSLAGGLLNFVIALSYYGYLEGTSGQTLGKKAVGIKVVDTYGGGPIGIGRAVGRDLARILSTIPVFLGYFWMLWDSESQTWHDKLANSYVVRAPS